MNVIITLAGHSRRFVAAGYAVSKAFIPINGRPMIAHVVEMFDPSDRFFFVVNSQQVKDYPACEEVLHSLAAQAHVVIVEPHELGPTYSALQVASYLEPFADEPVVISYCDFYVEWNYKQFLKDMLPYDAGMPAFRGFHPASYGHTYYAYLKTRPDGTMESLQEKKPFTEDRVQEPASAGIYYFSSWSLFQHYAQGFLGGAYAKDLPEAYVSLLFNPMVNDGLSVRVTAVEKFICWGTPEDLEQYLFWLTYFQNPVLAQAAGNAVEASSTGAQRQTNAVVLVEDRQAFIDEGCRTLPALIPLENEPLVLQVCQSLPVAKDWLFVSSPSDFAKDALQKNLQRLSPANHYSTSTDGADFIHQALVLVAKNAAQQDPLLLAPSCDLFRYNEAAWQRIIADPSVDGVLWTFRVKSGLYADLPHLFYAVCDSQGVIQHTTPHSPHPTQDAALAGPVWLRHASDLGLGLSLAAKREVPAAGASSPVAWSAALAPILEALVTTGRRFVIFDVDHRVALGHPFGVQLFDYWQSHFFPKKRGMG